MSTPSNTRTAAATPSTHGAVVGTAVHRCLLHALPAAWSNRSRSARRLAAIIVRGTSAPSARQPDIARASCIFWGRNFRIWLSSPYTRQAALAGVLFFQDVPRCRLAALGITVCLIPLINGQLADAGLVVERCHRCAHPMHFQHQIICACTNRHPHLLASLKCRTNLGNSYCRCTSFEEHVMRLGNKLSRNTRVGGIPRESRLQSLTERDLWNPPSLILNFPYV